MKVLIAKLGATGDVVRTTSVLRHFEDDIVTWLTAEKNTALIEGVTKSVRCIPWGERQLAAEYKYDLVINLEDTVDVAGFLASVPSGERFGAFVDDAGSMRYTESSQGWFDLSLISRHGRKAADERKLLNRSTYQELLFSGLGIKFTGQKYVLPPPIETDLQGDVAIAPEAGPVWPMKAWAYYAELKTALEKTGLKVNVLPHRASLLEHLGDVRGHRCLVSGDSLPMHMALAVGTSIQRSAVKKQTVETNISSDRMMCTPGRLARSSARPRVGMNIAIMKTRWPV